MIKIDRHSESLCSYFPYSTKLKDNERIHKYGAIDRNSEFVYVEGGGYGIVLNLGFSIMHTASDV
jgi:hypothetical protein